MGTRLKGKSALITGSGKRSGIGYAIAKKMAGHGANVIITDLGENISDADQVSTGSLSEMDDIVQELSNDYGVTVNAFCVDVTSSESITNLVEDLKERQITVDILVNNAGASFGVPNAVHTYDEDKWMATIDVNLHGVFRISRAILPLMFGKQGKIINIASRAGKVPPLFNGAYAVAKAGVIMLTKVMAKELAGAGIRVNAICPGQIMTELEEWRFGLEAKVYETTPEEREKEMCKTIPLNRIGNKDEVADLALYLSSDESSYITGQALNICGGQLMEL